MKNKGFNIISVIIIILITSIISALTTGLILNNNYKGISGLSYTDVMNDEELSEFLSVYSTIIENFYEDVDTSAMLTSAINAMKEYKGNDKNELVTIASEAMLSFLGDDYTQLLSENENNNLVNQLKGTYEGIGIAIKSNIIQNVTPGSPAEQAGLLDNDVILNVNGTEINENNSYQISFIIGNSESEYIDLTIQRNQEIINYSIKKTTLDSSVNYHIIDDSSTGYINISMFSENVDSAFEKALIDLESLNMTNLIIDMRNNSGGYLDKTQEIASLFLEKGKIIYSLEENDDKTYIYDETDESRNYKVIILLNEESASASEILAAALVDSYGAEIVGTKSYGKGKVQKTASTESGEVIKYTSAKWYTPNNICIDEIGLYPTYEVELEYIYNENNEITNIIDRQLEKAIELLEVAQ